MPVFIYDNIPENTTFTGNASCVAQGTSSGTSPIYNAALDRIEITAVLGPDLNAPINSNPSALNNEIFIEFDTLIDDGMFGNLEFVNQTEANWDENNNGDPNDDEVVTDSSVVPETDDPTVVTTSVIHNVPTLNWWSMLVLILIM